MYFIIGLVIATIAFIHNCKEVHRVRKEQEKRYLDYLKATDNNIIALQIILGTCPEFYTHSWAVDYIPLVIGAFMDVVIWPLYIYRFIRYRRFTTEVKYNKDGWSK